MMPAVGDSPLFIGALKDLVLRAAGVAVDGAGDPGRAATVNSSGAAARSL